MKMIKNGVVIETNEFLKNIWTREGFVDHVEEKHKEEEPKNKGGRPKAKP